jgi:hypothetical protein
LDVHNSRSRFHGIPTIYACFGCRTDDEPASGTRTST